MRFGGLFQGMKLQGLGFLSFLGAEEGRGKS